MCLDKQIYLRKSCRKYSDEIVDLNLIDSAFLSAKSLIGKDVLGYKILTADEVNIKTRWRAPYYLALQSEKIDSYKENLGFVFQQVSLYLQSKGIGSCWVGMAGPKFRDDNFVIAMSFGRSSDMTRALDDFKRKNLNEISDYGDEALIPAQLAPSAVNSQPWYFKHCRDGSFDVYQVRQNIFKRKIVEKWNLIDVGIALAHMYVANSDSFEFFKKSHFDELKNKNYVGSIII